MEWQDREDDLDDENYWIREVYAQFGLAIYLAQVLEHGMVNILVLGKLALDPNATQSLFDTYFDDGLAQTMGQILRHLRPFLGTDSDLVDDLETALQWRNRFVHSFFRTRVSDFATMEGKRTMLLEVASAQEFFRAVDARLEPVLLRYLENLGITASDYNDILDDHLRSLGYQGRS